MSDIPHDPLDAHVEWIGPFSEYYTLAVGGYKIPYLTVHPTTERNDR